MLVEALLETPFSVLPLRVFVESDSTRVRVGVRVKVRVRVRVQVLRSEERTMLSVGEKETNKTR